MARLSADKQPAPKIERGAKDQGAVLLTTLLIMSVMALFTIIVVEDILRAVKRTAQIEGEAQASRYIQGADDYAQSYLEAFITGDNTALVNQQLLAEVTANFPLEGGIMNVTIRDSSNCLSLGLLNETEGAEIFTAFFETLGWPTSDAQQYASRLSDWVDEDEIPRPQRGAEDFLYLGLRRPHRTANTFFETVFELRALDIFEEREFQFLRPYVCAHASSDDTPLTQLNVNTLTPLQAPLLAVALGGAEHLDLAERLLSARPPEGWDDLEQFWSAPEFPQNNGGDEEFDRNDSFEDRLLGDAPNHIWVDVTLVFQGIEKRAALEYRVGDGDIQKTYRYFGDESHWPRPINLLEDTP